MAQARLFVPQEAVEHWLDQGRAELSRDVFVFEGRQFHAQSAVRFLAEVASGADPRDLIGRVLSCAHLERIGAEHTSGAVLLAESAYQVAEGYLLTLDPDSARAPDAMARLVALFA